ncbi:MAG TPA: hypothetical protein VIA09_07535, partial [Nitrososphaeraceae archaeon]
QKKLTISDLATTVQDTLNSHGLLKRPKSALIFAGSHIEPFHKSKQVSFYSDIDDKLFILPTFPMTGTSGSLKNLPAIMSGELIYELNRGNMQDFTEGVEPPFVSVFGGDKTYYLNRQFPYITSLEKFLGAKFSKYIPKNETVLMGLAEIQSKLSTDFGDGRKVVKFLNTVLSNRLKDSDLDPLERKIMTVLYIRLKLVDKDEQGGYYPIEDLRATLKMIKGLCEVTNPTGKIMSAISTQ